MAPAERVRSSPEPLRSSPERVRLSLDLVFRRRHGELVSALTRAFGLDQLDLVEDVVHDAFVCALRRWPYTGVPEDPGAWILTVARNRGRDVLRRQGRWRERAPEVERSILARDDRVARACYADEVEDDQLRLMFACCHPVLSRDAQVALTLKTVGGFGADEIARAFLTRRATVAQRIVRAKRTLRERGVTLAAPTGDELAARRTAVLETLYLMFNEGYSALEGDDLVRSELCREALRLVELLAAHRLLGAPSVDALAALFGFLIARESARVDATGELVPLEDQDRSLWDAAMLARAVRHLSASGRGEALSSFHLEAEIASCHSLAPSWGATDWRRILDCYDALIDLGPSPVVALNRLVALAEVEGPEAALRELAAIADAPELQGYEARWASEGDLRARVGQPVAAARAFEAAAQRSRSAPVRRHLRRRSAQIRRASVAP
jgi:RNA polymerase sigma-70 factor (ECF subfamily)